MELKKNFVWYINKITNQNEIIKIEKKEFLTYWNIM